MFTKSLLSRPDEPCLQNHCCQEQTNHVYKIIAVKTRRTMFTKSLLSRPDEPCLQSHWCQDQTNHVYKVIGVKTRQTIFTKPLLSRPDEPCLQSYCCRLFQDTSLEDHTNQVSKSLLSAVSRYQPGRSHKPCQQVLAVGCFKILAWKITQTKLASHSCRLFSVKVHTAVWKITQCSPFSAVECLWVHTTVILASEMA